MRCAMRNCQGKFKQKNVAFVDDKHIVLIFKLNFANFSGGKFHENEFALH